MRRINGERVKLVTSFDELRPGALVYVLGTKRIAKLRRLLANLEPIQCTEGGEVGMYTTMDPPVFATRVTDRAVVRRGCICPCLIRERRLYVVVDEQLDSDSTGECTSRELERTR